MTLPGLLCHLSCGITGTQMVEGEGGADATLTLSYVPELLHCTKVAPGGWCFPVPTLVTVQQAAVAAVQVTMGVSTPLLPTCALSAQKHYPTGELGTAPSLPDPASPPDTQNCILYKSHMGTEGSNKQARERATAPSRWQADRWQRENRRQMSSSSSPA